VRLAGGTCALLCGGEANRVVQKLEPSMFAASSHADSLRDPEDQLPSLVAGVGLRSTYNTRRHLPRAPPDQAKGALSTGYCVKGRFQGMRKALDGLRAFLEENKSKLKLKSERTSAG